MQRQGMDYTEVYSPVARIETIRMVVAVAVYNHWKILQLDVKSAFLNGPIEEEVYVRQPPGFMTENESKKVYKLKKALYGLKQAPRAWNLKIDSSLQKLEFIKCSTEFAVYVKLSQNNSLMIVCLYVDDMIVTSEDTAELNEFKQRMMQEFEMSDLGELSYFLGMEFSPTSKGVLLHQKKYASDILRRFNMQNCNPAVTPMEPGLKLSKTSEGNKVNATLYKQIIGSLRYLCNTRPDIAYSVGVVSRFMEEPRETHLLAAKRILRYVKGSLDLGILFPVRMNEETKAEFLGFTDADWCGDQDDRKSTAGYIF